MLTTRVGGLGINPTIANTDVVLYDSNWCVPTQPHSYVLRHIHLPTASILYAEKALASNVESLSKCEPKTDYPVNFHQENSSVLKYHLITLDFTVGLV